jgi:hypothetical protein
MNGLGVIAPLRVPEVGPSLGKVVIGTGNQVPGIPLESIRYRLATRIIEAAGEARQLAAGNERPAALQALGRDIWMEAWDEAVTAVTQQFAQRMGAHLVAEAQAVRMPKKKRRAVDLDDRERRALAARFGSAGTNLMPALDALEERAAALAGSTGTDATALDAWQEAVTVAARRLEAGWLEIEVSLLAEVETWLRVADEVARWRKPLWPVLVVGLLAVGLAAYLGLMVGGVVSVPAWANGAWAVVSPWLERALLFDPT